MCTYSMVGDYFRDTFPNRYPSIPAPVYPMPVAVPNFPTTTWTPPPIDAVTRAEFDKLKAEVEELKKLLAAAKEFDDKTGQRDCETAEKIAFLREVAKFVGVDLKEVL